MEKFDSNMKPRAIDLIVKFEKSKEDPTFQKIINEIDLPVETLRKYTSSLVDAANELNNCKNCKGLEHCKNSTTGYYLKPDKSGSGINFSFVACSYKQKEKYKKNISFFDVPLKLREASIKNIYTNDKNRVEIIKKIKEFYDEYLKGNKPKGIYLYGSFGSGKSYITAALLNELAKKDVESVIVHVPELIRSIKESFDTDYSDRFYSVKTCPILLLDDIGAEYLTPWARDEILEPILQYRMDEDLPTFFTSNYDYKELEKHFIINDDKMKAKRLIERVKVLSNPVEMVSKNVRN